MTDSDDRLGRCRKRVDAIVSEHYRVLAENGIRTCETCGHAATVEGCPNCLAGTVSHLLNTLAEIRELAKGHSHFAPGDRCGAIIHTVDMIANNLQRAIQMEEGRAR